MAEDRGRVRAYHKKLNYCLAKIFRLRYIALTFLIRYVGVRVALAIR
jgi:hypothetical protein